MVQCAQQTCLLANPVYFLRCPGASADVVHFADDMLPGFNLRGQEDHGMAAVPDGTISDDISILEELWGVLDRRALRL
jgi:hypothetical protein